LAAAQTGRVSRDSVTDDASHEAVGSWSTAGNPERRQMMATEQPAGFNPQGMVEAVLQAAAQRQGN